MTIEPEDLLPKLPSPKDLQPFPTIQSLVFNGHTDMVRCISIDPLGQYLLSGSDDMTIKSNEYYIKKKNYFDLIYVIDNNKCYIFI